ncbi:MULTISPECIES: ABC transporter permease [Mesoflavibacter]|jgi:putative ABC transport system permease protein|uniref:ABC transporter permease n=1 Tax=Mesoflavibacter zeaxanthinifaciens subsp. sabulilitoris TaxID=1520893 RepID=A0A2T1NIS2_9FLAO|nr:MULTISPECIES: ABC transporter permease [Mesoflavibacter]MBB3124163.1 putative ABC transport system permease protein [Mesoflavibacter zeaxanthinifaciens subsp. sabulilitoris]MCP4051873.1 ABC transporter permease [Mesoflavibacter sp.]PSG92726.1 ABC transporter permease [Mesoflavibacter zeaxanthinifaciens subsp. sabulilitoris]UAB74210.1 ABC transporter permease [Mesoflavibacter sp. SCSIO 43206]
MKFLFERDTWQEVYESLSKNKLRTILTMVGVWWGILLLIGLLGAARGLENSFNRLFGDFATNSVFVWGQSTSKPFKGFQEGRQVQLQLSDAKKVEENVEGIEFVVPRNQNQAQVVRNFLSGTFSLNGDYPLLDKVQKKKLIHGRFINQNDIDNNRKVVVISEEVYKQLFEKDAEMIGEYVQINDMNFKVIGMFQNGNVNMGPTSDMHIPFTTFQQIYNLGDRIGWMMITGKPEYDIAQIEQDAKLLLRNLNRIHPEDNRAFGSFNLGKEFKKVTGFLVGMQFLTWFVGIATLIAGVFAIGNILLITVKERTKEIGVRRALGATPFEIKRQILVEAVFLTIFAGILGIISGGWILIALDAAFGQGDEAVIVNASVSIAVVFIALIILVVLGTLIGLIPAFKATSIKPIEALREE